jgi:hypothetical protein
MATVKKKDAGRAAGPPDGRKTQPTGGRQDDSVAPASQMSDLADYEPFFPKAQPRIRGPGGDEPGTPNSLHPDQKFSLNGFSARGAERSSKRLRVRRDEAQMGQELYSIQPYPTGR